MFEILREWIENLNFGRSRLNSSVFEKLFISYSCIRFIKFNALKSFRIILLCFSKNWFFPEFRPIEIATKNVCKSLSVSIGARLVLDQLKHFQPIKSVFQSIENRVENFLKNSQVSCAQTYFFKSFSTFSLSIWLDQGSNPIFCHFPPLFCKVFLSQGR